MINLGRIADHEIHPRRSLSGGVLMTLCNGIKSYFLAIKEAIRCFDIRPIHILLRQRFVGTFENIRCHYHQTTCSQNMPKLTIGKVLFYPLFVVSNPGTLLQLRLLLIRFVWLFTDLLLRGCLLTLPELFSHSDILRNPHGFTFRDQRFTSSDPPRSSKPYSESILKLTAKAFANHHLWITSLQHCHRKINNFPPLRPENPLQTTQFRG
jgi:hypothetical protein